MANTQICELLTLWKYSNFTLLSCHKEQQNQAVEYFSETVFTPPWHTHLSLKPGLILCA